MAEPTKALVNFEGSSLSTSHVGQAEKREGKTSDCYKILYRQHFQSFGNSDNPLITRYLRYRHSNEKSFTAIVPEASVVSS
jgi:hypothetical protein